MSTITEHRILFFRVADLAQICLFVGHFPVADTLAVPFAVFVATDVFIPGLFFDVGALAVTHVFNPITLVGVTSRVLHLSLAMAFSEHKVALINSARARDVLTTAVIVALQEIATVEVTGEGCFNRLGTCEALNGVVPGLSPQVLDQTVRTGEKA